MNLRRHLKSFQKSTDSDKINTIIGSSVEINGPLSSKKDLRIDGIIHGDVKTGGNIIIGPTGIINGDVSGKNITVCGVVNGSVVGKDRVILTSKARVSGNLTMEYIVVDEGALLNGNINMLDKSAKTDKNEKNISDNTED